MSLSKVLPAKRKREEKESANEVELIIPDTLKRCLHKVLKRYQTSKKTPEIKTFYFNSKGDLGEMATESNSIIANINFITQGTTLLQRVGNKVQNEFLLIDFSCSQLQVDTTTTPGTIAPIEFANNISVPMKWYISVVIDRQANNGTPGMADIYDQTALNNQGLQRNPGNIDRFDVIYSKAFITNNIWAPNKTFTADIPLHYLQTFYPQTTDPDPAENIPITNGLYLTITNMAIYQRINDYDDDDWFNGYFNVSTALYFTDC